jgi:hypothetical protein
MNSLNVQTNKRELKYDYIILEPKIMSWQTLVYLICIQHFEALNYILGVTLKDVRVCVCVWGGGGGRPPGP